MFNYHYIIIIVVVVKSCEDDFGTYSSLGSTDEYIVKYQTSSRPLV